jgi:hypothetical protein
MIMTTKIVTQSPSNTQLNTQPLAPGPAAIRLWIQRLRAQHGDILNAWPDYAIDDYHRLRRELMRIEASNDR